MSDDLRQLKSDASNLVARGDLDGAVEVYRKILTRDPKDMSARQRVAEIYARLGRAEDAVAVYETVVRRYITDGQLLKAIALCKIILQIDPTHTRTQQTASFPRR